MLLQETMIDYCDFVPKTKIIIYLSITFALDVSILNQMKHYNLKLTIACVTLKFYATKNNNSKNSSNNNNTLCNP